jgi:hypothetical protein
MRASRSLVVFRGAVSASVSLLVLAGCGGGENAGAPPRAPVCPESSAATGAASAAALPAAPSDVHAASDTDEGMWLLNDFPAARVEKKYGFSPSKQWLEHVRLSSVRLAFGCSGSIVSDSGLVMTNHHCAEQCIQQLSSAKKDFVKDGFYAKTEAEEVKCPEIETNQLVEITDVTERVLTATRGLVDKAYIDAQRGETSKIEKECATSENLRCDVVNLYHGGRYHLYKYRRYQDTRLVFAPEFGIAFFGGDPDNFNFPRYDLDVAFLRVYEGGKPLKADHHFAWSAEGAKENELTFVSGHPGGTSRQLTIAQLEYERDVSLPRALLALAQHRGMLSEFMARGKEQKRVASGDLFYVENGLKALRGRHKALLDKEFFGSKVAEERALRAKVDQSAELKTSLAGAWDAIAAAQRAKVALVLPYAMLERGEGFESSLFDMARGLLRAGDELTKRNETRLREYGESRLPGLRYRLLSSAPIYDELETLKLTASLIRLREELGADHPIVKSVLGKEAPQQLAARLIKATKLKDAKVRRALLEGGKAAVDAAKDPMIELARLVDGEARSVRSQFEDKVESVEKKQGELVSKAVFAALGTSTYPDATFSLRLSFGHVAGWEENGRIVPPFTTFGGAFERASGNEPFALPASWLGAKAKLDLAAPFDMATTNDIIGGNSGSPVVNKDAEIVGLIFDGNIHSLGGEYGFDPRLNRAVAVHSGALLTALDKIYGASRIVGELKKK